MRAARRQIGASPAATGRVLIARYAPAGDLLVDETTNDLDIRRWKCWKKVCWISGALVLARPIAICWIASQPSCGPGREGRGAANATTAREQAPGGGQPG